MFDIFSLPDFQMPKDFFLKSGLFRQIHIGFPQLVAVAGQAGPLRIMQSRGIRVVATMVHQTHPQWFEERGHFTKLENRKYFERYLEFIVPQIAPYVDFWNVLNEFNLYNDEEHIQLKLACVQFHALGYHVIKRYFGPSCQFCPCAGAIYGQASVGPLGYHVGAV